MIKFYDRNTAIGWSRSIATDPDVVYLDTETTGFGPNAQIVDIAIVNAAGEIVFESLVRPRGAIPIEATNIHGITDEDVIGAPTWRDVWPDYLNVVWDKRVCAYNARFDFGMVCQDAIRAGFDPLCMARPWECAMEAFAAFSGVRNKTGFAWKNHKLDLAAATFEVARIGHRAASDAQVCRQVVLGMAGVAVGVR